MQYMKKGRQQAKTIILWEWYRTYVPGGNAVTGDCPFLKSAWIFKLCLKLPQKAVRLVFKYGLYIDKVGSWMITWAMLNKVFQEKKRKSSCEISH